MKMRVERFANYRKELLYKDDGELPIAKVKGKHLKNDGNISSKKVSYRRKLEFNFEEIIKNKSFIISLFSLVIFFIILGIILAL